MLKFLAWWVGSNKEEKDWKQQLSRFIKICLSTPTCKPSPAHWVTRASINGRYPSAWVNEESTQSAGRKIQNSHSVTVLLPKRQNPFPFLLLLVCLKISSTQREPMQMPTKVDRNATVTSVCACGQKRMKTLFPSPETLMITISWSQPRHRHLMECLFHTLPSEMPPH